MGDNIVDLDDKVFIINLPDLLRRLYTGLMLAASTLRAGLHEQDSETMDLYLFILVVSGISSYLHSEAEINLNKRVVYVIFISKIKYTAILIFKYNIKLLIKEYE